MVLDCEVLVVGAGPTGLTVACELARRGIQVRIIDAKCEPTPESRALGIQARSLELLEKIDLTDELVERGLRLEGSELSNQSAQVAELQFELPETRYPFILSLPQSETERLLIKRLEQLGVDIEWQTSLVEMQDEGHSVEAAIQLPDGSRQDIRAHWLIGCDGAHSLVRRSVSVEFAGEREPEWYALADVRTDWQLSRNRAHVFLHSDGPLAVFPLPQRETLRIIAPLLNQPEQVEPRFDLTDFEQVIARRTGQQVQLREAIWLSSFRISRRIVSRYRVGRVFLAGDAAHVHSPAGGQGMNTGIHDAFNLAWKLALVEAGMAKERLLDSYHAERHPIGVQTLRGTRIATQLITLRSRWMQKVRDALVRRLSRLAVFRRKLSASVSMLAIQYRQSPIVEECLTDARAGLSRAGDRAPDFVLEVSERPEWIRLHDVLRSARHVLLLLDDGQSLVPEFQSTLQELCNDFSEIVDAFQVCEATGRPISKTLMQLHAIRGATGYAQGALYLIRPDGYIAWRGPASAIRSLDSYLRRWLSPSRLGVVLAV